MPKIGQINATWTPEARETVERFIGNSNVFAAVLTLSKMDDVATGSRWSYSVYSAERLKPLGATMEARGYPLLHDLGGLTVAISDVTNVKELDSTVIDLDGPGYLLARSGNAAMPSR